MSVKTACMGIHRGEPNGCCVVESNCRSTLYEQSLALRREVGDRWSIAQSLNNLGQVANDQCDFAAARSLFGESLGIFGELGDRAGAAHCLSGLAVATAALPDSILAGARFWGAAERLREEIGGPVPASEQPRYEQQISVAREALGDDARFDAAWQEGRVMSLEQAIELALKQCER